MTGPRWAHVRLTPANIADYRNSASTLFTILACVITISSVHLIERQALGVSLLRDFSDLPGETFALAYAIIQRTNNVVLAAANGTVWTRVDGRIT